MVLFSFSFYKYHQKTVQNEEPRELALSSLFHPLFLLVSPKKVFKTENTKDFIIAVMGDSIQSELRTLENLFSRVRLNLERA